MEFTYMLVAIYFVSMLFLIFDSSEDKKQIKKLQRQINELSRLTGHNELVSIVLSEEEKEMILHFKNTGKNVKAIKMIMDLTGVDLKEAKKYLDSI